MSVEKYTIITQSEIWSINNFFHSGMQEEFIRIFRTYHTLSVEKIAELLANHNFLDRSSIHFFHRDD